MNINLVNNRQQQVRNLGSNNNKQNPKAQSPSFKGAWDWVTPCFDYLVTNPIWGATATDVTSMGGPRTIVDGVNRGLNVGVETGIREFSSTANDASVGLYGLAAGGLISTMLSPLGLKNPKRIFASNESLDVHSAKWEANGGNLDNFVSDYVNNLEGFNPAKQGASAEGYVRISEADKPAIVEDFKKLADVGLSDKDRGVVSKRLKTRILESVGSDNQLRLSHAGKSIEADSNTVLDDFFRLTKAFREKKPEVSAESLLSRIKAFGKSRALLGLGAAMLVSASVQPLNVWMTKRRTGSDGFAGMPDREKDTSTKFKMKKLASAGAMAGIAMTSMQAKPSQLLDKMLFKSLVPSMNQIKGLYAVTICSRMLSARDDLELGETNRKDILGFLNWLIIGNLINKGFLMGVEDKKNPLVRMSANEKNKKGIIGGISKFFNSNIVSRREVLVEGMKDAGKSAIKENGVAKTLTEMLNELPKNSAARKNIKWLNIGQAINYAYTIAVLGYGIPKMNILITEKAQKKRQAEKEQMVRGNVMTQANQQFVDGRSGFDFTSFKSQKSM